MKKAVKKRIKQKTGVSLTEMLVCVILVSLISMLACTGILSAYENTHRIEQAAYRQELGMMLLNRVVEELSEAMDADLYCTSSPVAGSDETKSSDHKREGAQQIAFSDSTGIKTRIYVNTDNRLEIWYMENMDSERTVPDSFWTFPERSYHGYEIKDLTFECGIGVDNKVYITTELSLCYAGKTETIETFKRTACCRSISGNKLHLN